MQPQIEFKGKLQLEDIVQFSQAVSQTNIFIINCLWLAIVLSFVAVTMEKSERHAVIVPVVVLTIIFLVSSYFLTKIGLKNRAKKIFTTHKLLQAEVHYIFSNEGLKTSGEFGNLVCKWDNFYCARMSKKHIGLFLSAGNNCYIIPRRWLELEHCAQEFEELLRLHLPASKIKQVGFCSIERFDPLS